MNQHTTPLPIPSTTTVSYEAFLELYKQVQELTKQVEMLDSIAIPEWLNRKQAMTYLQCSSTKLWELQHNNIIEYTYSGSKPLYSYKSCQKYLKSRNISNEQLAFHLKHLLALQNAQKGK